MSKELLQQAQEPAPMQGLAAYLRCEAGEFFNGTPARTTLLQWAKEVEAAIAQPVQEPVYQYQLANGAWIDQAKESYDYNVKHGKAVVRVLYAHLPIAQPVQKRRSPESVSTLLALAIGNLKDINKTLSDMFIESPADQPAPVAQAEPLSEIPDDHRMLLIHSLVASKGWMHGYAAAFVDDWFHARCAALTQTGVTE